MENFLSLKLEETLFESLAKINFKATSPYLKRIMNAHYVHHKVHTKRGGKAFGFLFAPKEYDIKKD